MGTIPTSIDQRVELLKKLESPYYNGLDEDKLRKVVESARLVEARQGEFLCQQGELASYAYVLLSGLVKIIRYQQNEKPIIVKFITPGLGFRMANTGATARCLASAQAATDARALRWNMEDAARLLQEIPQLALNSLAVLTETIMEFVEALGEFACGCAEKRLMWVVRRLAADLRDNDHASLPITQQELGACAGLSLYTVNRTLRLWEQRGLLEKRRHLLIIHLLKLPN